VDVSEERGGRHLVGLTNLQVGWADARLHRRHQVGTTKETNTSPEDTIDIAGFSRLEAISTTFVETEKCDIPATQHRSIAPE
jgi:hypothetical protein